jgi:tetratricopeptide (TPR) repeat protein
MLKYLITASVIFFTSTSVTAGYVDTTAKFTAPSLKSLYLSDYSTIMAAALDHFAKDSIDKAIPLLYQSLTTIDREKNVVKASGYHLQEVFAFADLYSNGKLNPQEAEETRKLFKQLFNATGVEAASPFRTHSKASVASIFERRIDLFKATFEAPKTVLPKLEKLLKEDSELLSIRLLKSEIQLYQAKYVDCINSCSDLLKLSPGLAYCYNLRGVAYRAVDKNELAVSDFKKAQSLCPDYLQASLNLADACMDSEKYADAIMYLKAVLSKAPLHLPAKYSLAKSYYKVDSLDSALIYMDEYIRSAPEVASAHDFRGDIYYDMEKYPEAVNNYSYAIRLAPDNSYYYSDRGAALYSLDKVDDALADFMKSYDLDKSRDYTLKKIGDCYAQKEDYKAAISWYKKALKADPEYKYSLVSLGNAYTHLKQYDLAIGAFEKAIKIDSTYHSALGNLGWTLYCAGNYTKSVEYSYKALKYNDEAVYAMFNIPLAVLRSGEFERAKQLYEHFIQACKEKKLKITEGAVTDLEDLIKEGVMVEQCNEILKTYFNKD